MKKAVDFVILWSIALIPFSMSISNAPVNVFCGFLIFSFLLKKITRRERILEKSGINIPLALFFIITILSISHSVNIRDTFKGGILRLLQYVSVLYIVAQEVKSKKHITLIICSLTMGILLVSVDSVWQVITGRDFIRGYGAIINIGLKRATASFKDSNVLGTFLSALLPIPLGLSLFYSRGIKKTLLLTASLSGILAVLLTYSRPTLLAIYVVLLFFAIARKSKAIAIFLILLTLASPFLLPKSVKNWAREVEYNPLRFMCNDDRIAIYRNSLKMIKAHPIIGLGANTFMKNYKQYKESPEYRNVVTSDFLYAHNNFLQLTAELGLTGLAIFIWLLYKVFQESFSIYKRLRPGFLKVLSFSIIACLISFLVNGLTESSLYSSRIALIFWYLIGFSLALKKFCNDKPR